jgi:hypothetical protein
VINIYYALRKIGLTPKEYALKKTKKALQNEKDGLKITRTGLCFQLH